MDKICLKKLFREFVLWSEMYSWGTIVIGRDAGGFLILYGITKGNRVLWNAVQDTLLETEYNLDGIISRARSLANEIGKDPYGYVRQVEFPNVLNADPPQDHGYCRCTIEPTE